jgi:hypothetical protein
MKAQPPKETTGVEGKVDFLNLQFEGLRRQLNMLSMRLPTGTTIVPNISGSTLGIISHFGYLFDECTEKLKEIITNNKIDIESIESDLNSNTIYINLTKPILKSLMNEMYDIARQRNVILQISLRERKFGGSDK